MIQFVNSLNQYFVPNARGSNLRDLFLMLYRYFDECLRIMLRLCRSVPENEHTRRTERMSVVRIGLFIIEVNQLINNISNIFANLNRNSSMLHQIQLLQSTMDSESEQIQPTINNSSFFSGFNQAPKLTQKEKNLRTQVYEGSAQQTKQTTLDEKIIKRKHRQQQSTSANKKNSKEDIFREKVVVEGRDRQEGPQNNVKKNKLNKSFQDLRLIKPLLKAISDVQYTAPTPIQQLTIPVIMSGRDVVASSITGSGKTAAFLLPILQRYYNAAAVGYIRALVVTPTRELAVQIYEQFAKLNKYTKLEAVLVIGASSIQKQQTALRNNPEVVIGTPGRIIDLLMNSRSIGMEDLEMIVFDEADKLLQLGFQNDIKQIMTMINNQVQTVLFSATMGQQVNKLTASTTRKPIRVSADPDHKTAEKLHQQIIKLRDESEQYRQAVLLSILLNIYKQKTIVFFKTKKQCHRMTIILGLLGIKACQLHGNLSQTQRLQAFLQFKEDKINYMMATDLAARGLDIKQVKTVINYELPTQLTRYIHRIGRTARAGNIGSSLTLCGDSQCLQIKKMSKKTGDKLFKLTIDEKIVKENERKINSLSYDINNILAEEREQRDLRKADMQLKKLENITEHQAQIYSRPKKQWFMTEVQKKKIQQKAKAQAGVTLHEEPEKRKPNFKKQFKAKNNGSETRGESKNRHHNGRNSQQLANKRKFIKKDRK